MSLPLPLFLPLLLCCQSVRMDAVRNSRDADLLQLALNCKARLTIPDVMCNLPVTVAAAEQQMPGLLEPGVACKLLLTAALRQHTAAVMCSLGLLYTRDKLDVPTLTAALEAMLLAQLRVISSSRIKLMPWLCLPDGCCT
jgi:hypothetical protein